MNTGSLDQTWQKRLRSTAVLRHRVPPAEAKDFPYSQPIQAAQDDNELPPRPHDICKQAPHLLHGIGIWGLALLSELRDRVPGGVAVDVMVLAGVLQGNTHDPVGVFDRGLGQALFCQRLVHIVQHSRGQLAQGHIANTWKDVVIHVALITGPGAGPESLFNISPRTSFRRNFPPLGAAQP